MANKIGKGQVEDEVEAPAFDRSECAVANAPRARSWVLEKNPLRIGIGCFGESERVSRKASYTIVKG